MSKILLDIIKNQLETKMHEGFSNTQFGFHKYKGTRDAENTKVYGRKNGKSEQSPKFVFRRLIKSL